MDGRSAENAEAIFCPYILYIKKACIAGLLKNEI